MDYGSSGKLHVSDVTHEWKAEKRKLQWIVYGRSVIGPKLFSHRGLCTYCVVIIRDHGTKITSPSDYRTVYSLCTVPHVKTENSSSMYIKWRVLLSYSRQHDTAPA